MWLDVMLGEFLKLKSCGNEIKYINKVVDNTLNLREQYGDSNTKNENVQQINDEVDENDDKGHVWEGIIENVEEVRGQNSGIEDMVGNSPEMK